MAGMLVNLTRNEVIAKKVRRCDHVFSRLKGLLGTDKLNPEEACWLIPCNMVHTIGMRYPIDVIFLNKKKEIVSIIQNLKPNRFSPLVVAAHSVVEFAAGAERKIRVGEQLEWKPAS